MMDETFVKEIERLALQGKIIEKEGLTYSSIAFKPVFHQPRPSALSLRTLTGLADYLRDNRDGLDPANLTIQIRTHEKVVLISKIIGIDRDRDEYITVGFDGSVFPFGEFMDSEKFIIAVNALFLPTTERDELLGYVSALKIEEESNISDNGIVQSATVRQGVKGGLVEPMKKNAPARPELQPYRTFSEVEQPESAFVFRMRQNDKGGVSLALFEADGGVWKSEAMQRISQWLQENVKGVSIIA